MSKEEISKLIDDLDNLSSNMADNPNRESTKEYLKLKSALERAYNQLKRNTNFDNSIELDKNNRCYFCKCTLKGQFRHNFYNEMCNLCGVINFNKRDFKKNLKGHMAIVTGGRVKIGFETAVRLLRNGCTVVVTTRFVDDCLKRYSEEKDFDQWKENLTIYQLNMLSSSNIQKFINYIFENFDKVDYLINNAAQTIRRPSNFYQHLLDYDYTSLENHTKMIAHRDKGEMKYLENTNESLLIGYDKKEINEIFPQGELDEFKQQIDMRTNNSWMLEIDQVNLEELAEVHIINAIAPYVISSKLKPLLVRKKKTYSWIINVSSMEGVFNWAFKPTRHPHTNMAKAALNMMTRTCGKYFIKSNIVMVSVDTGWNNYQHPQSYDKKTPLDCVDGAARILDPIYRKLIKSGIFYKDFKESNW